MHSLSVALTGNPNCGKTTLFNALTGSRQRVGNWPGVTVERIEGEYRHAGTLCRVIDLPGIYSFSAFSIDESIAREYILGSRPDVVVNVLDATNLERNLYLTTQLLEMRVPLVIVLNMMDMAEQQHTMIDVHHLATHVDCPVVPVVASRREGIEELRQAVQEAAERAVPDVRITYDREVEEAIVALTASVTPHAQAGAVNPRWLAIRMLEKDRVAERYVPDVPGMVQSYVHHIERHTGEEIDMVIADGRYGFIHGLTRDVVRRADLERVSLTTLIDNIVLNRVLGIPIFFLVMYLIFMLTINVGTPFIEFFDRLCGAVFVDGLGQVLEALGTPAFLRALVADGMGGGVQTVSTFIPPIFFIFLCLAVLEDSGYMARAAFVMDRVLRAIGLPGKAFLPMLVGFGCNVPAILATRTLENPKDRVMTAVMNPFVSCGARLPVYTVFAVAFFPRHGGTLVFALYVTGILLGVLTGLLLRHTLLRGEASTFVMELPPYHMPTVPGILHHTWNNLRGFISRAGKVILAVVVVLSLLNLPLPGTDDDDGPQDSPLSVVGRLITPVFRPMGIRDANWPATVGLFTGLFAKEAVVGTLDSLYAQLEGRAEPGRPAVEPVYLPEAIRHAFAAIPEGFGWTTPETEPGTPDRTRVSSAATPALHKYFETRAAAVAYILFILLYAPCMATLAAIYRETGLRWMAFSLCHMTGLAWLVSTCVYQVTRLTEAPAQAVGWLGFCALALLAAMAFYQHLGRRFAGGRTP